MAAEEKTVYQLVNDYFMEPRNRKLLSKYMLSQYNYRTSRTIESENFIYFQMEDETELFQDQKKPRDPKIGDIVCDYGLKFHIRIPEWDGELYKKGFDLLLPLLMGEQVEFKFLRSQLKMSEQKGQAGKDITIYANMTPHKSLEDWTDLITRITAILVENSIPPGYCEEGTKPEYKIKGCSYVTYRYENEATKTHKRPKPDPVTSIRIIVQGQENPIPYITENPQDRNTIKRDAQRLNL